MSVEVVSVCTGWHQSDSESCETHDVSSYSLITSAGFWSLDGNDPLLLLYCLCARTKPCLYSTLPLMVYLHSFLLSNRVPITFPFHEKGGYLWPAPQTSYSIISVAGFFYHLLKPPARAFNTLQLFSNYFECMHGRFWGHTCDTSAPPLFPKTYLHCKVLAFKPIEHIWKIY